MADKTGIEWADATWNPTVGCSIVSPGCTHCYAMKMAARLEAMGVQAYAGLTEGAGAAAVWKGTPRVASDRTMLQPLLWSRPRRIFVNSMSDLFHPDLDDETIDRVFAVMALAKHHTFLVLTKRPERMFQYVSGKGHRQRANARGDALDAVGEEARRSDIRCEMAKIGYTGMDDWPLPNVWLGTSVEDRKRAEERIVWLVHTPAAKRFLSLEPLLGHLDLRSIRLEKHRLTFNALTGYYSFDTQCGIREAALRLHSLPAHPSPEKKIDWVIVGGESGPGARPMHPDWPRWLRSQCAEAGVPFFFKQWGDWSPELDREKDDPDWRAPYSRWEQDPGRRFLNLHGGCGFHGARLHVMRRVGKRASGALLDGQEHMAFPA